MYKLIVWYNPRKQQFYHKIVRGYYTDYKIGFKNQYNHSIVYIISLEKQYKITKRRLKESIIETIILYLKKLERR